jgi:hypothetical protein
MTARKTSRARLYFFRVIVFITDQWCSKGKSFQAKKNPKECCVQPLRKHRKGGLFPKAYS